MAKVTKRYIKTNLRCRKCEQWKPGQEFYDRRTRKGTKTKDSWCIECRRGAARARYVPAGPKEPVLCQNPACGATSKNAYVVEFGDETMVTLCQWCQRRCHDGAEELRSWWMRLHQCLTTNVRAHPKVKIDLRPYRQHERCEPDSLRLAWLLAALARHGEAVDLPTPNPVPESGGPRRKPEPITSRLDSLLDGLTIPDPQPDWRTAQPDVADTRSVTERMDDLLANIPLYGPGAGGGAT